MVSIITPAYNASGYITETINSIVNQTYKDWELIVVDDCSTDDTVEVINRHKLQDKRIRLIKAENNGGVAKARNLGLKEARGEYIAFLDSDDLWKKDKLERQLAFMEERDCILSYTDFQHFDSITGVLGKVIKCPTQMRAKDILKNTTIGCLTVMVDKRKAGEFNMPDLKHTEDNCCWYNILKRGYTAYNVGEVLSLYRVGNSSLTKNKGKSARQQWDTYRKYFKFSIPRSAYYYVCYAFNAILRHL